MQCDRIETLSGHRLYAIGHVGLPPWAVPIEIDVKPQPPRFLKESEKSPFAFYFIFGSYPQEDKIDGVTP